MYKTFVRQLHLVEAPDPVLDLAVRHYYRAYAYADDGRATSTTLTPTYGRMSRRLPMSGTWRSLQCRCVPRRARPPEPSRASN